MRSVTYLNIIVCLIIVSCSHDNHNTIRTQINLNDTISKTVIKLNGGDSVIEHQVITFTPTDQTVPMDSFYYWASDRHYTRGEEYRVYFDRIKVIAYCDSILKALGPKTLDNFSDWGVYNSILNHARKGRTDVIYLSETHYLLNRFRPLIVNNITGHRPNYYFTINRKSPEREDMQRDFVSEKGDTFGLSWTNIWLGDIKIDTTR